MKKKLKIQGKTEEQKE